jgi:MFS family permease
LCCLAAPIVLEFANGGVLILFLLFWGMVVVADSPLFSTLVAQSAPVAFKGTALTIVNCIGFSISIISIQLLNSIVSIGSVNPWYFMILALGPILGLLALELQK